MGRDHRYGLRFCIIPESVRKDLSLQPIGPPISVIGIDRTAKPLSLVMHGFVLDVPGLGQHFLKAVALDRTNLLLGRDFVSQVFMVMNGRRRSWRAAPADCWLSRLL